MTLTPTHLLPAISFHLSSNQSSLQLEDELITKQLPFSSGLRFALALQKQSKYKRRHMVKKFQQVGPPQLALPSNVFANLQQIHRQYKHDFESERIHIERMTRIRQTAIYLTSLITKALKKTINNQLLPFLQFLTSDGLLLVVVTAGILYLYIPFFGTYALVHFYELATTVIPSVIIPDVLPTFLMSMTNAVSGNYTEYWARSFEFSHFMGFCNHLGLLFGLFSLKNKIIELYQHFQDSQWDEWDYYLRWSEMTYTFFSFLFAIGRIVSWLF